MSTSVSPVLDIYSVKTTVLLSNKLYMPIQISKDGRKIVETLRLIDSGAGGRFIDQNFVKKIRVRIQDLETPMHARNIDGMEIWR